MTKHAVYTPSYNQVHDHAELLELMRMNSFGLLVTAADGVPTTSHLPCVVETRGAQLVLVMHMAFANLQCRQFCQDEVLVVFSGPHGYISPRWYEQTERVPTWSYAADAYGIVWILEERTAKHASVAKLVRANDPQWHPTFEVPSGEYLDSLLGGIVAFEVEVARLDARWKLSQNRGRREQELIAEQLTCSTDSTERALAALTRRHLIEK